MGDVGSDLLPGVALAMGERVCPKSGIWPLMERERSRSFLGFTAGDMVTALAAVLCCSVHLPFGEEDVIAAADDGVPGDAPIAVAWFLSAFESFAIFFARSFSLIINPLGRCFYLVRQNRKPCERDGRHRS